MTALESAMTASWAMLPEKVEQLVEIAGRLNETSPQVLEAYRSARIEHGERVTMRDGVAIIEVSGPLFKRANLFTSISGATSYDIVRRDLQVALDDPAVSGIILKIDSPGGEANGCDELANAIYAARGTKPISSYVSGTACSGGYWIAAAAERIVVSELANLGSIGVVLGITDRSKADAARGVRTLEFVSSVSPHKRPNIETDEGKAQLQRRVDDMAEVFVGAVARMRGVSPETVIEKFGGGGVQIGAKAVAAGMADSVGQFEELLASLSDRGATRRSENRSTGGFSMSDKNTDVDLDKVRTDAAATARSDERKRVAAIMASDEAKAFPKLAAALLDDGMSAEDTIARMKAAGEDVTASASQNGNRSFEDRKADGGALIGFEPAKATAEAADAAWGSALKTVNRPRGDK